VFPQQFLGVRGGPAPKVRAGGPGSARGKSR
jgi:hypothetical protein